MPSFPAGHIIAAGSIISEAHIICRQGKHLGEMKNEY